MAVCPYAKNRYEFQNWTYFGDEMFIEEAENDVTDVLELLLHLVSVLKGISLKSFLENLIFWPKPHLFLVALLALGLNRADNAPR